MIDKFSHEHKYRYVPLLDKYGVLSHFDRNERTCEMEYDVIAINTRDERNGKDDILYVGEEFIEVIPSIKLEGYKDIVYSDIVFQGNDMIIVEDIDYKNQTILVNWIERNDYFFCTLNLKEYYGLKSLSFYHFNIFELNIRNITSIYRQYVDKARENGVEEISFSNFNILLDLKKM